MHDSHNGNNEVADEAGIEHDQQDDAQLFGKPIDEGIDRRLNDTYGHEAGDTPEQREFQTDIAFEVKAFAGVIPPVLVENFFQDETCDEFDSSCKDNGTGVQDQDIITQGIQSDNDGNNSKAVDRAVRTVKEAAVDESAVFDRLIHDFQAPAEEGIDNEEPEHLVASENYSDPS